ncbi:MAG: hypothetical protein V4620_13745 [Bacteroidota bacterium]
MIWKIIGGSLLFFAGFKQLASIILDYTSGTIAFWPFGAEITCIGFMIGGIYIIRQGLKQRKVKK